MGRKTGKTDLASKAKYGKNDYPLVFMAHYFRYVEGLLDEVAIFNRALTEGDIAKIMDGLKQNVLSVSVKDKLPTQFFWKPKWERSSFFITSCCIDRKLIKRINLVVDLAFATRMELLHGSIIRIISFLSYLEKVR
jgi:hypothetical protein